ncbi:MAG: cyclase family protein [Planctomycetales bacterium]|nr:cyclase family protein [Planctomycetales bacterium]
MKLSGQGQKPTGFALLMVVIGLLVTGSAVNAQEQADSRTRFVDCSLLVAPEYPATWPTHPFPRFQLIHEQTIGPNSPFSIDVLLIDGNTGTQMDVPPHSVVRPELNREKSGPLGLAFTDKIEAWQFGGEACVVDVREMLDKAPNGVSPLIMPAQVEAFEKQHRQLRFGDVVLFRSDYSDKYYRPFPDGHRYIADVADRLAPGYPDPGPETMEFLATRGVMTLGTDSASMGPMPNLAEPTHYAGLRHGMIWTEGATNLSQLPSTGAFYCMLSPKHADGMYSETRVFAIVGGELPKRLIESTRNKRAVDLSPTLSMKMPVTNPGALAGRHRQVYVKVDFLYSPDLDLWHHTHLMDATTGTHLITPSFALPPEGTAVEYSPQVRGWLEEYEAHYGKRGSSSRTTEQVPLEWTCGDARVVDVRSLVGTTDRTKWPSSPEVTVDHLKAWEKAHGEFTPWQIVIFQTGHIDTYLKPTPEDKGVWIDPLTGKSEGWPAPGPDAIQYLRSKGIRCVATDAPDLGGVDPRRALMTYWALGSADMVGIEFLNNVGNVPEKSYFLFAPVRIRDAHAGPGRAIVLH